MSPRHDSSKPPPIGAIPIYKASTSPPTVADAASNESRMGASATSGT